MVTTPSDVWALRMKHYWPRIYRFLDDQVHMKYRFSTLTGAAEYQHVVILPSGWSATTPPERMDELAAHPDIEVSDAREQDRDRP